MPEAKQSTGPTLYASSGDFRRIFHEETDSLYRLSFLLTADREKAEQCFVSGFEDSVKGRPVFKEWARSWARRVSFRTPYESSTHAQWRNMRLRAPTVVAKR